MQVPLQQPLLILSLMQEDAGFGRGPEPERARKAKEEERSGPEPPACTRQLLVPRLALPSWLQAP